jgi:hypothetical protein
LEHGTARLEKQIEVGRDEMRRPGLVTRKVQHRAVRRQVNAGDRTKRPGDRGSDVRNKKLPFQ